MTCIPATRQLQQLGPPAGLAGRRGDDIPSPGVCERTRRSTLGRFSSTSIFGRHDPRFIPQRRKAIAMKCRTLGSAASAAMRRRLSAPSPAQNVPLEHVQIREHQEPVRVSRIHSNNWTTPAVQFPKENSPDSVPPLGGKKPQANRDWAQKHKR